MNLCINVIIAHISPFTFYVSVQHPLRALYLLSISLHHVKQGQNGKFITETDFALIST